MRLRLIGQMEAWSLTGENVLPPGTQDPGAARGRRAVGAAPGAARPAGRTAVEPPAGGAGPRLAAPGNPSPAGGPGPGGGGDPANHPRPHLAQARRRLGGCRRGDARDHRPARLAVAAGRRPAGGSGRDRSRVRRLARRRARAACATGPARSPRRCCASRSSRRRRSRPRSACCRSTARMKAPGGR